MHPSDIPFNNNQTTWGPKTSKEERFLTMAMGVALSSKCKFRHGAIVVKHGKVLGASPNLYKNDPRNVNPKYCQVHAEIAALKRAGWPSRATIYVARVNGLGYARLSKPCSNCQEVLNSYKAKVVWTK